MVNSEKLEDKLIVHNTRNDSSPLEIAWENILKVKEELDDLQKVESCYFNPNELKIFAEAYKKRGDYLKAALTYFKGGFIVESETMFDKAMDSRIYNKDYLTPAVILWKFFKAPLESVDLLMKQGFYKPALEIAEIENLDFCARQIKSYMRKE